MTILQRLAHIAVVPLDFLVLGAAIEWAVWRGHHSYLFAPALTMFALLGLLLWFLRRKGTIDSSTPLFSANFPIILIITVLTALTTLAEVHLRYYQWLASEPTETPVFDRKAWGILPLLMALPFIHRAKVYRVALHAVLGIVAVLLTVMVAPLTSLRMRDACEFSAPGVQVPRHLVINLLSAEDPLYAWHSGVDFHRLRQAVKETLDTSRYGRGGSTLTMQLAKMCYLGQEKTLSRKLQQVLVALWLESGYSKQQLLSAYLESVPFGSGVRGISQASRVYFAKNPADLTEAEGLALVTSVFDPEKYPPTVSVITDELMMRRVVIRGLARAYRIKLSGALLEIGVFK